MSKAETPKLTKSFKKDDFQTFMEAASKLDLTYDQLTLQVGFTAHAWKGWQAAGQVPACVGVACALLAERADWQAPKMFLAITIKDEKQRAHIDSFLAAIGASYTVLD